MIEIGKVVGKEGEYVTVRFERKSACGKCGICAIKPNDPHIDIEMKNTVGAEIDNEVEVNMTGSVVMASIAVYLMPLCFAFLGMGIGFVAKFPEWGVLISFFAGLAIGFIPLKILDKKWAKKKMQPKIVAIKRN